MDKILFLYIIIPLLSGLAVFFVPKKLSWGKEIIALFAALVNLVLAAVFFKNVLNFSSAWLGGLFDFSFRLYHFSAFIILSAAVFLFLITLYSSVFMREKNSLKQFYAYLLITTAFVNGAVLADNLLVMLLFWEGSLLTTFGLIFIGGKEAFKTAIKAVIIVGICDLCMMFGIILTGHIAGTLTISQINLPLNALGSIAFIFLMIGAISKAGSMPFHTWIPDAAIDAPLPFMAFLPAALEKLLGIYFLTRICLDMYKLTPLSWVSTMLMIIGSVTIILAVMMALVQKNYKRLLSYHAISQVGYMILGIGTAVPAGIIGGLFHMINNAMYKSALFLTGGAVEKQAGTADLEKLGGLGKRMPITFLCFIITAASISGVPPFNGFFSKELLYDGALERGAIFYLAAIIGSFFTAASFLKLGHSAFMGKLSEQNKDVKEAPFAMLVPMIIIAFGCIVFGVWNYLPLAKLIQPILNKDMLEGHNFWGMPSNIKLVIATVVVLIAALANHIYGVKKSGSAIKSADHIHHAPVLRVIYDKAQRRFFDTYDIGLKIANVFSVCLSLCDKAIDYIYNVIIVKLTDFAGEAVRKMQNGSYSSYLGWSLAGILLVMIFLLHAG